MSTTSFMERKAYLSHLKEHGKSEGFLMTVAVEEGMKDPTYADYVKQALQGYFLRRLRQEGKVTVVCGEMGIPIERVLMWAQGDALFRDKWEGLGKRMEKAHVEAAKVGVREKAREMTGMVMEAKEKALKRAVAMGATAREMAVGESVGESVLKLAGVTEEKALIEMNDNRVDARKVIVNGLKDPEGRRLLELLAERLESESGGDGGEAFEGDVEAEAAFESDFTEVGRGGDGGRPEDTVGGGAAPRQE